MPAAPSTLKPRRRAAALLAPWPLALVAAGLVCASFAVRFFLLELRHFGPDEFQHLHRSWSVARGLLPYRDFFDHHPPGLPVLLWPLFALFEAEAEVGEAFRVIFLARGLMGVLALGMVALTFALAARWRGVAAGWVAAALLATTVLFFDKTTETRPDVPAAVTLLGGWLLALRSVEEGGRRRGWAAAGSGLAVGLAALFTPKAAFALPGLLALLLAHPADEGIGARGRRLAWFTLGALALPVLTFAGFAAQGAGRVFLECTVWINARWRGRLGPQGVLLDLLRQNPLLLPLALAGAAAAAAPLWRGRRPEPAATLLLGSLAGFALGLLAVPVVYRQYALLFLAVVAALAAGGLLATVEATGRAWTRRGWRSLVGVETAAAAALLALGLPPLAVMARGFDRDNTRTLDDIRFIHRNTAPWETVMDGFTGWGVFRPHACYYYFLHGDLRLMLGEGQVAQVEEGLRAGRIAPKLILYDRYLRSVSPGITEFLERNYVPVGRERIRVRLFDNGLGRWDDTGLRRIGYGPPREALSEPHVVIGEGWRRAEADGERAFRRCPGRCVLLVPVSAPRAFTVVLEARAPGPQPAELDLRVNGRSAGQAMVGSGWSQARFTIPSEHLGRGLNRFALACSAGEPQTGAPPGVAVASLRLQPAGAGP